MRLTLCWLETPNEHTTRQVTDIILQLIHRQPLPGNPELAGFVRSIIPDLYLDQTLIPGVCILQSSCTL